jgi:signal transduction histidine kinase
MKKILVVDDDAQMCAMLRNILTKAGYDVSEAGNGETGMRLARQLLPDLILTDIHMPGGDGSTLLREVRHDPALATKQVVLMTGRPDLVTPRRGMEEGADDFLVKPISIADLLKCVSARFSRAQINWRVDDQILERLRASVPPQLPHEFFTPLAGIIGLMELLRDSKVELSAQEVRGIHDDVYQSSLRLHRALRNFLLLLDLRDAVAKTPAPPALLNPSQVAASIEIGTAEALRLHSRSGDLTMRVASCAAPVRADDLVRIAEELVDNACKFSRPGTPVVVEFDGDACLTVTDHGRGMTSDEISEVGAFRQFDRKRQEQAGLGLGLALVQRLAALNRADFAITSNPGAGTTVRVAFVLP